MDVSWSTSLCWVGRDIRRDVSSYVVGSLVPRLSKGEPLLIKRWRRNWRTNKVITQVFFVRIFHSCRTSIELNMNARNGLTDWSLNICWCFTLVLQALTSSGPQVVERRPNGDSGTCVFSQWMQHYRHRTGIKLWLTTGRAELKMQII